MKKWEVQPEQWHSLTFRQQKKLYKSGVSLAWKLAIALVVTSLLVESVLGL